MADPKERLRWRLTLFYQNYNPKALDKVDVALKQNLTEEALFQSLAEKYQLKSLRNLQGEERAAAKKRITQFYVKYNPKEMEKVEKALSYDMTEEELFNQLYIKYNVDLKSLVQGGAASPAAPPPTPPAAASPPGTPRAGGTKKLAELTGADRDAFQARITAFYQKYNPAEVHKAAKALEYDMTEDELMEKLYVKYPAASPQRAGQGATPAAASPVAGPPPPAATGEKKLSELVGAEKDAFLARIHAFYQKYNPAEIHKAAKAADYDMTEAELMEKLYQKYPQAAAEAKQGASVPLAASPSQNAFRTPERSTAPAPAGPSASKKLFELTGAERDGALQRITAFYQQHNPAEVQKAAKALSYDMTEAELMEKLESKYRGSPSASPQQSAPSPPAPAAPPAATKLCELTGAAREAALQRLTAFYNQYNPAEVQKAAKALDYDMMEAELMERLEAKYVKKNTGATTPSGPATPAPSSIEVPPASTPPPAPPAANLNPPAQPENVPPAPTVVASPPPLPAQEPGHSTPKPRQSPTPAPVAEPAPQHPAPAPAPAPASAPVTTSAREHNPTPPNAPTPTPVAQPPVPATSAVSEAEQKKREVEEQSEAAESETEGAESVSGTAPPSEANATQSKGPSRDTTGEKAKVSAKKLAEKSGHPKEAPPSAGGERSKTSRSTTPTASKVKERRESIVSKPEPIRPTERSTKPRVTPTSTSVASKANAAPAGYLAENAKHLERHSSPSVVSDAHTVDEKASEGSSVGASVMGRMVEQLQRDLELTQERAMKAEVEQHRLQATVSMLEKQLEAQRRLEQQVRQRELLVREKEITIKAKEDAHDVANAALQYIGQYRPNDLVPGTGSNSYVAVGGGPAREEVAPSHDAALHRRLTEIETDLFKRCTILQSVFDQLSTRTKEVEKAEAACKERLDRLGRLEKEAMARITAREIEVGAKLATIKPELLQLQQETKKLEVKEKEINDKLADLQRRETLLLQAKAELTQREAAVKTQHNMNETEREVCRKLSEDVVRREGAVRAVEKSMNVARAELQRLEDDVASRVRKLLDDEAALKRWATEVDKKESTIQSIVNQLREKGVHLT